MASFGEFRVEDWYEHIAEYTYATKFITLTVGAANAIKHHYEEKHKHFNTTQKNVIFTENDQNTLKNVTSELQSIMDNWSQSQSISPSFFVRLSTRSPKDATVKSEKFKNTLQEKLRILGGNEEPRAVIRTLNECIRVNNAQEAMDLIVNSQRVYYDISRSLLMLDEKLKGKMDEEMPDQKLIVRLFHVMEAPEYEFRVFVRNKRITAVTQYFKSVHLRGDFDEYRERIMERIQWLSDRVLERIEESHVLDIAVDIHDQELQSYIIELNPFSKSTSAALFDWNNESDEKILRGDSPFEFRYVKETCSVLEARKKLSQDVQHILQEINPLEETTSVLTAEQDTKQKRSLLSRLFSKK